MTAFARQVGHAAGTLVKAAQDFTGVDRAETPSAETPSKVAGKGVRKDTPPAARRFNSKKHSKRKGRRKSSPLTTESKVLATKKKVARTKTERSKS
jgi:hypothetical protein